MIVKKNEKKKKERKGHPKPRNPIIYFSGLVNSFRFRAYTAHSVAFPLYGYTNYCLVEIST
jgi:hypothetical protein